jgi:hypothetical protein
MTSDYFKRLDVQGHLKVKEALRKWDPIGVYAGDSDWPDDEYDSYSGPVVSLLDSGAPKERILQYLRDICENHISLSFDRPKTEKIIEELITYWSTWKEQIKALGPDHIIE